jgi:hypothetical protein
MDANTLADELEALAAKATAGDLHDGGRWFAETCSDLTQCHHGDTGEYGNRHDGKLIEKLWNNLPAILAALRAMENNDAG